MYDKIVFIAEFCCNHSGSIEKAKEMIDALADQGEGKRVDIIKFQKRTPKLLLSEEKYNAPHPKPENSFGKTYGEHREFLEFSVEQHQELKKYCEDKGFIYSSSVFDSIAMENILSLNPKMIKIGAANNTDLQLLNTLVNCYDGEIHISMGCITEDEQKNIIKVLEKKIGNVILYACTSAYPPKSGENCLLEIEKLKREYGSYVKAIGFSGHHLGIYPDVAALVLGATYFERHYTLDRNSKGTDHKISLLPDEFGELVKVLNDINKDLIYKPKTILECEKYVRENLKCIRMLENNLG